MAGVFSRWTFSQIDERGDTQNMNFCILIFRNFCILIFRFQVARLSKTEESAVLVLSRCLPHIVPNVLLNKREVSGE
jgi:hypothetical protein